MSNEVKHVDICKELVKTYVTKNHDYGDSSHKTFEEFGITAYCVRLSDKLNRLISLSKKEAQVKDETIRDTLMDLANYAIMAVMDLDEKNETS